MITIISGKYKGRKLSHINNTNVRPTQAKVKKSVFDILGSLDNKEILDLYSGVGSFGIESLSRGAKNVKFIENNKRVISILKYNINMLNISSQCEVVCSDVFKFLKYTLFSSICTATSWIFT